MWCVMGDVNAADRPEVSGRMCAVLIIGVFAGLISAVVMLAQGGGWLAALAIYSGAGTFAVLATATLAALRCRMQGPRAAMSEPARS